MLWLTDGATHWNGFVHEFERDCIPNADSDKPPLMLKLASVNESLVKPKGPLEPGKDAVAHTELERLALSIPAPGPSLGERASKDVRLPSRTGIAHGES